MKKFNLDEAMAGKPVQTRSGKKVTQLSYFECISTYKIIGVIEDELMSFTIDGIYRGPDNESSYDLVMVSEKQSIWVNVYKNVSTGKICTSNHDSLDEAFENKLFINGFEHLKTIEITNEP